MEKIKKLVKYRTAILMILDIFCIAFAYYLGVVLITDSVYSLSNYYIRRLSNTIIVSVIVYQVVFHLTGRYKSIIRYEEGKDYLIYFFLCLLSGIIITIIRKTFKIFLAETKVTILASIFIAMLMISYRLIVRYILVNDVVNKGIAVNKENRKNLLIIGAGNAAHEIIKTIHTKMNENYNIIGIIDDNKKRLNYSVSGVKIIGNRNDIVKICEECHIDFIFFSIANIDNENKKQILNICQKTRAKVRILPGMKEIIKNKKLFENLRDVEIEDILGREPVKLDNNNID